MHFCFARKLSTLLLPLLAFAANIFALDNVLLSQGLVSIEDSVAQQAVIAAVAGALKSHSFASAVVGYSILSRNENNDDVRKFFNEELHVAATEKHALCSKMTEILVNGLSLMFDDGEKIAAALFSLLLEPYGSGEEICGRWANLFPLGVLEGLWAQRGSMPPDAWTNLVSGQLFGESTVHNAQFAQFVTENQDFGRIILVAILGYKYGLPISVYPHEIERTSGVSEIDKLFYLADGKWSFNPSRLISGLCWFLAEDPFDRAVSFSSLTDDVVKFEQFLDAEMNLQRDFERLTEYPKVDDFLVARALRKLDTETLQLVICKYLLTSEVRDSLKLAKSLDILNLNIPFTFKNGAHPRRDETLVGFLQRMETNKPN